MGQLNRRAGRLGLALLIVGVIVAAPAVVEGAAAQAAECSSADFPGSATPPLFPSCFEGADGDMTAAGSALDWQSVAGNSGTVVHDGTGASDDTFLSGSKEQVPSGWGVVLAPSSPKDDIFAAARDPDFLTSHVYLNLASIAKGANGSFDLSFELNQLAPGTPGSPAYRTDPTTNVALPARTTGDILLAFDTNGGLVTIGVCRWQGDHDTGQWLLLNGTALDNTNDKACTPLDTATAQGALNAPGIAASSNFISNVDVPSADFGELSVDLTKALAGVAGGQCVNFRSWWLRTRSSNQVNSNPEDLVLPQPIDASNCPRAVTPPSPDTNPPPPGGNPPPPTDNPAPVVSALSLDHRTWRLGSAGMTVSFQLSQAASARLAFSQARAGRRVGHSCVAPTRRNRHRRRCTHQVSVGTLTIDAHAGLNRVRFGGRLPGHKLRPGHYTLTITTTDATHQRSAPSTATFTVLPKR